MNALRRCAAVSFVWYASLPRGISNWDKTRYDQSLVMFIPGKEAITNWSKYFTAGVSMASQSLLLFSPWWSSSTTTGMSHWPSTTPSWTLACSSLCLNISRCDSSTLHSAQTDAFFSLKWSFMKKWNVRLYLLTIMTYQDNFFIC